MWYLIHMPAGACYRASPGAALARTEGRVALGPVTCKMVDRADPDALRPRLFTPLQQILGDRACDLYGLGKSKQAADYGEI